MKNIFGIFACVLISFGLGNSFSVLGQDLSESQAGEVKVETRTIVQDHGLFPAFSLVEQICITGTSKNDRVFVRQRGDDLFIVANGKQRLLI